MTGLMNMHMENVKQAEKTDKKGGSTLGFAATSTNPALGHASQTPYEMDLC